MKNVDTKEVWDLGPQRVWERPSLCLFDETSSISRNKNEELTKATNDFRGRLPVEKPGWREAGHHCGQKDFSLWESCHDMGNMREGAGPLSA